MLASALIVTMLGVSLGRVAHADAPSLEEAQAIWDAFWARVRVGDLDGAYRYVHTSRRGSPLQRSVAELQEIARQMAYCRLRPGVLPPLDEDVLFEVHCEHAGETADTLAGFQRDLDGTWRLTLM